MSNLVLSSQEFELMLLGVGDNTAYTVSSALDHIVI